MNTQLLDSIVWGNPSREDKHNIDIRNYLSDLLPELCRHKPYKNSSHATRQELNKLLTYSELQAHSERKELFDGDLVPFMNQLFENNGVDPDEVYQTTLAVVIDVQPLITQLKYAYQRPRPFQLAYYHGLKFFPSFSKFVSSPSYPSGHTVLCAVMGEVLATHYASAMPGCYEAMLRITGEVAESRLYMGVHYPSDNQFALQVSQAIIRHPSFRQKYEF